ncbi:MAG TPA: response regulator [Desulfobulbaceae bacterium]|nr:response regulator [Desulfobulbaceae bacterium]
MQVLLVDDERELISTLSERLSFRGIASDWVTSGEGAIDNIKEKQYDIAVLDIKMPGLSGIELAKKIRDIKPDMKIIFVTGHGSAADFEAGSVQSGEDYYLAKPLNIDLLIEKMQEVLK